MMMRVVLCVALVVQASGLRLERIKPGMTEPQSELAPQSETVDFSATGTTSFSAQLVDHLTDKTMSFAKQLEEDEPPTDAKVWKAPSLMSLDGCKSLYLDLGSNRGGNIRALYQESSFGPGRKTALKKGYKKFMAELGDAADRAKPFNESGLCAIAFEGNPAFRDQHLAIETAYNAYGWKMQFMSPAIVLDKEGSMTFWTEAGEGTAAGSSIVHRKDKKHVPHTVPAVNFPQLVEDYIVPARKKELKKVIMHMDVESAEYLILPKLAEGEGLCQESGIDEIIIEWHAFTPKDCVYCNEKAVRGAMKKKSAKRTCTSTKIKEVDIDLYRKADDIPLPVGHA